MNTKEITTVTEVWIPDTNLHRFWRFYSFVYSVFSDSFEKLYQTLERVFHQDIQTPRSGLKNLGYASVFNPLLSVWISDETLFLVFDILHKVQLLNKREIKSIDTFVATAGGTKC